MTKQEVINIQNQIKEIRKACEELEEEIRQLNLQEEELEMQMELGNDEDSCIRLLEI
jgi:chromosome segregation ATPase